MQLRRWSFIGWEVYETFSAISLVSLSESLSVLLLQEVWALEGFNFLLTFLNYDEIVLDGKKDGQEFSEQVHVYQEVSVDDEG